MTELAQQELQIRFDNEQPVNAAEFAGFLSAISKDYARYNQGHQLSISRLEAGSIISAFRDLAEHADQVNHLYDFAKNLFQTITIAAGGVAITKSMFSGTRKRPGLATAEAMMAIPVHSGGRLEIDYKSTAFSEQIHATYSRDEARAVYGSLRQAASEARRERARSRDLRQIGSLEGPDRMISGVFDDHLDEDQMLRRIEALGTLLAELGLFDMIDSLGRDLEERRGSRAANYFRRAADRVLSRRY